MMTAAIGRWVQENRKASKIDCVTAALLGDESGYGGLDCISALAK